MIDGIDENRLAPWIGEHVLEATPPFSYKLIAGGRSNLTFEVVDATGQRFVLRRPPLGHLLPTAHDVLREHRIVVALHDTGVPVPEALAACGDATVNGAPFFVMRFVDGVVLDSTEKAAKLDASAEGSGVQSHRCARPAPRRRRRDRGTRRPLASRGLS